MKALLRRFFEVVISVGLALAVFGILVVAVDCQFGVFGILPRHIEKTEPLSPTAPSGPAPPCRSSTRRNPPLPTRR